MGSLPLSRVRAGWAKNPNRPRRWLRLTSTTPRRAKALPSYTEGELPPFTKPPPWIQNITGSFAEDGFSGAHTFT